MRTVIQFLKNLKIFKKQKMTPFNILNHIFTWTLLGLLYISCVKQPNGSRNETDFVASVQNHWTDLRKNHFLSGSIIIKKNAQILFSDGDLDEKFLIGSVSKSFVGYYFFTNQDKILLDTKVCVYIKTFCAGSFAKVSVGSLLQHRSGFTRYFEATNNIKNAFSDFKLADLDKLALDEDDFDVEKYTKLSYSNMGYNYLSRIIEIIEQKQFYEVIAAIATEAHLKSTYLSMPNDKIKVGLAIPYISSSIKIPIINQAKIAHVIKSFAVETIPPEP